MKMGIVFVSFVITSRGRWGYIMVRNGNSKNNNAFLPIIYVALTRKTTRKQRRTLLPVAVKRNREKKKRRKKRGRKYNSPSISSLLQLHLLSGSHNNQSVMVKV